MNRRRFSLAKIVTIALCIVLLPCWGAFAGEAEEQTSGDFTYVVQEDGTAKITDYNGDASSLTVPEALDGYAVTAIGDEAFDRCKNLTEIALPDGLTAIGKWAFSYCHDLAEITLPDSLMTIGDGAFANCENLTEITLPVSLESIGRNPFADSGVQIIHVSPDHPLLATIDGVLFSKPDKRLICYPSSRTDTAYAVPEGILAIGNDAFSYCENLTEITLPDSLTTIGILAFSECKNLTEIMLPDGLTNIGDAAFSKCEKLTEITMPDSLESIGLNPFEGSGIQIFYVSPDHPFLAAIDGVLFSKPDKRLICYPYSRTDSAYAVPEGILIIGDDAFYDCENLTEITLPDSLTTIGDFAFSGCRNLKEIPLPDSLTTIGKWAFALCENLTEITLPDGLTNIGDDAFYCCENLTEITLPDGLTAIGDEAFARCDNLSSIIVGRDSYAREYCIANDLPYSYADANDWLLN